MNTSGLVNLPSERLIVRDWRIDEAPGRFRIFGNAAVRRFLSFGYDTLEDAAKELHDIVAAQTVNHPRPEYFLAVEQRDTRTTIGNVGFEYRPNDQTFGCDVAEIGYFFEPGYWGKGYATEAANLIIRFACDVGAEWVLAECDTANTASEKLMQRCGMTLLTSNKPGRLLYGIKRQDIDRN